VRKFALTAASVLTLAAVAAPATAAPNPSGTGQPNQSCEEQPSGPAGFNTGGFATADQHYANPDAQGGTSSGNSHVVSQYDVACFQVSQH
jgi:hypothetical protein